MRKGASFRMGQCNYNHSLDTDDVVAKLDPLWRSSTLSQSQSLSISRIAVWAESCVHTAVTEYLGKQAESGV